MGWDKGGTCVCCPCLQCYSNTDRLFSRGSPCVFWGRGTICVHVGGWRFGWLAVVFFFFLTPLPDPFSLFWGRCQPRLPSPGVWDIGGTRPPHALCPSTSTAYVGLHGVAGHGEPWAPPQCLKHMLPLCGGEGSVWGVRFGRVRMQGGGVPSPLPPSPPPWPFLPTRSMLS